MEQTPQWFQDSIASLGALVEGLSTDSWHLLNYSMIIAAVCVWPYLVARSQTARHTLKVVLFFVAAICSISLLLEYRAILDRIEDNKANQLRVCTGNPVGEMGRLCHQYAEYAKRGIYLHLFSHLTDQINELVHTVVGRWVTVQFLQVSVLVTIVVAMFNYKAYKIEEKKLESYSENNREQRAFTKTVLEWGMDPRDVILSHRLIDSGAHAGRNQKHVSYIEELE